MCSKGSSYGGYHGPNAESRSHVSSSEVLSVVDVRLLLASPSHGSRKSTQGDYSAHEDHLITPQQVDGLAPLPDVSIVCRKMPMPMPRSSPAVVRLLIESSSAHQTQPSTKLP